MSDKRLQVLIERHQELDDKVDKMSTRRFLSPRERLELKQWKVLRLRCRDVITSLYKELGNEVDSFERRVRSGEFSSFKNTVKLMNPYVMGRPLQKKPLNAW